MCIARAPIYWHALRVLRVRALAWKLAGDPDGAEENLQTQIRTH